MSSNLNYKQVSNVERRTWDKEAYEARAKARAAAEKEGKELQVDDGMNNKRTSKDQDEKEEFVPALQGAAGPESSERAFLKARTGKVDIDSKIGTSEMISTEDAASSGGGGGGDAGGTRDAGVVKTGVGWHCKVCDCFLKDSHTYLDHINGRKHQRKLGYSMRTERSTNQQLQDRIAQLVKARKKEPVAEITASDRIQQKDEEVRQIKEDRIKRREERKKRLEQEQQDEEEEEPQMDPAMAAMMGFSGFGGGNKNR